MQRPSTNSGLGSALGGGAAESAFGGETTKVLTKWTTYGIILFFLISLLLSMFYIPRNYREKNNDLPIIVEPINK